MVDETRLVLIPVDSSKGTELWEQMFKDGVSFPVRVVPTIATNDGVDYFILSFGFGYDPDNIEGYRTVAIPTEVMDLLVPDMAKQLAKFNMVKAN